MTEEQLEEVVEIHESFGEFLKRHREASGKSLEEIARVTRISKGYLAAFENNDLSSLPESTFARGFLKSYANEVGMDVDECLRRYDQFERASLPTQIRDMRKVKKNSLLLGEQFQSSKMPLVVGAIVVILFIIVTLGFYLYQHNKSDELAKVPEVIMEPDAVDANQAPVESTSGQAELNTPAPPSVLEISAKQRITLLIRLDDAAPQEIVLNGGEKKNFDVYRQIEIKNVDRNKLSFSYNAKPIEIAGPVVKLFNRHLFSE